jgi:hypothetical protein
MFSIYGIRLDDCLTTGFKNYVAYVTSHRAVVKRKKRGKR